MKQEKNFSKKVSYRYKYYPVSYDEALISQQFSSADEFVEWQVLYRKKFEGFLKKYINFDEIRQYLASQDVTIPIIEDTDYNFYHKYSTLGFDCLFFRNNFHVERLTAEEREQLKGEVDVDFFNSTIPKVVFENSEKALFSNTDPSAIVASKSLVFEFAFDQKKCENIDQFLKIRKIRDNVFKMLQRDVEKMGLSMSGLTYVAIPDIYRIGETNNTLEVKKTM